MYAPVLIHKTCPMSAGTSYLTALMKTSAGPGSENTGIANSTVVNNMSAPLIILLFFISNPPIS